VFQRHRHGAGNTGLPAGTATVRAGGHSERLFYRGDNRPPRARRYSASKGAVLSLTLAMAADLLRDGIRVNAVTPGTTDTPWIGRLLDRAQDPEGRTCRAERQPQCSTRVASTVVATRRCAVQLRALPQKRSWHVLVPWPAYARTSAPRCQRQRPVLGSATRQSHPWLSARARRTTSR
jgi:NAD(P)-dependent dehydrogenase (short-subunit alcohol dehydrogenase family)